MKKTSLKTPPTVLSINPLRSSTCRTLSRLSNLTYELGTDTSEVVHFRITHNDGGGFFSAEWISWTDVHDAVVEADPITSLCLRPLFKGKSVNTSGFLMAVLVAEGLLEPLPKKVRHFKATGKNPSAVTVKPAGDTPKKARKKS